jgi:hypothetical protein
MPMQVTTALSLCAAMLVGWRHRRWCDGGQSCWTKFVPFNGDDGHAFANDGLPTTNNHFIADFQPAQNQSSLPIGFAQLDNSQPSHFRLSNLPFRWN